MQKLLVVQGPTADCRLPTAHWCPVISTEPMPDPSVPLPEELGGPPQVRQIVDTEEYERVQYALNVMMNPPPFMFKANESFRNCLPFYGKLLIGSVLHVGRAAMQICPTACVWLDETGVLHLAFSPLLMDELENFEIQTVPASDEKAIRDLKNSSQGGAWHVASKADMPGSIRRYMDRRWSHDPDVRGKMHPVEPIEVPSGHLVAVRTDYSKIVAVCVHELLHVAYLHLLVDRSEFNDPRIANLAMDTSINQSIDHLPNWGVTIESWAKQGLILEPDQPFEVYYYQILAFQNEKQKNKPEKDGNEEGGEGGKSEGEGEGKGEGDDGAGGPGKSGKGKKKDGSSDTEMPGTLDDHEPWKRPSKIDELVTRDYVGRFRAEAEKSKAWGSLPGHLTRGIDKFLKPKVKWEPLLRRFIGDAIRIGVEKTRKRPSRRMGWDAPGRKIVRSGRIWVAIDNSGSISEVEAAQFMGEIGAFVDQIEVVALVWDTRITSAKVVTSRGELFRLAKNLGGGGGTDVHVVFDALKNPSHLTEPSIRRVLLGERPNGLVVLTDGDLSWPTPEWNVVPTLWAITQERNLKSPKFGMPIFLDASGR